MFYIHLKKFVNIQFVSEQGEREREIKRIIRMWNCCVCCTKSGTKCLMWNCFINVAVLRQKREKRFGYIYKTNRFSSFPHNVQCSI